MKRLSKTGLILAGLYAAVCVYGHAQAADVTISAMPAAAALGGTEPIPAVQSGANVRTTPAAIATYVRAGAGANPSASVGLSAVNGSATTFMRSDGAPALDVSIAPTWTGTHTWSNTAPTLLFNQTGAAADQKLWDFTVTAQHFRARTRTDANATGFNWVDVTRGTGTAVTDLTFGDATNNPTYHFNGSGTITTGGSLSLAARLDVQRINLSTLASPTPSNGLYSAATNTINFITNSLAIGALSQTDVSFGNAVSNNTFHFLGTGATTFSGSVTSPAIQGASLNAVDANPQTRWDENDQGSDLKWWMADVQAGVWSLRTVTDALGTGVNILTATRGATTAVTNISVGNATSNPTFSWLGTGTFSVGANISMTSGGTVNAAAINATNTTAPQTGIYRPGSNTLGIASNSVQRATFDSAGNFNLNTALISAGTKFTTTGCSVSSTTGGAAAGTFTLGANTCSVVITLAGGTGITAPNGWTCQAHDRTAPLILIGGESSSNATTATITIPATAGATDVISFSCTGY